MRKEQTMKNSVIVTVLSVSAVLGLGAPILRAQQSQPENAQGGSVRMSSEEVLLDVVVRDKKGHAIKNLRPEDFHIFDNGEQKQIRSFRLVEGSEAISDAGSRAALDPLRQIRLITLIFQSSSNDARRLARDASMGLLKGDLPQNVYMAAMTIDHKLEVIQAFTNDRALLKKAINRATHSENTDYSQDTATTQRQLEDMLGPNTNGAASLQAQVDNANATVAAAAQGGGSVDGTSMANIVMAQMVLQILQHEQGMAMVQGGRTTIYALLDAVKEQYRLPGRKTILYFTEGGFVVPQGMEELYKSVISIANRSNVSLYALDTRGLTISSSNSAAITALKSAGESATSQLQNEGTRALRSDEAKVTDTAVDSTRGNAQNTLADLAKSTGGVLIANTNDLRDPLRRLEEDVMSYYEITYSPQIANYDGSFRRITVKMSSNDLRVQTRSGYIALPPAFTANGSVLRSFEVPLLTALSSSELPHSVSYHSEAMHFRGRQNQSVCELVIDVPLTNLTLQKNAANQMEGRLSYVALLKDASGEIQKKFQNDIPFHVPQAQQESLKSMHFIYTEHFDLPPGRYTLESAVLDGGANKIGARKGSVMMPPPSNSLAMSSVSIVRSTKPREASTRETDPLLIGTQVVSPTVNPIINKADPGSISFYMVIYVDKAATTLPKLLMEFSRKGQVLGSGSPELSAPTPDGHIQYVATVPTASLAPGTYSVRFIVNQGSETAEEAASFTLQ
jgi:VWFA-related protein